MSARRSTLAALVSLCMLTGVLVLGSVATRAAVVHKYLSQITEVPAVGPHGEPVASHGSLTGVNAMTVAAGHLWTAEHVGKKNTESGVIDRLDESNALTGEFESQRAWPNALEGPFGVAVGNSTSETELYVPAEEEEPETGPVVAVFGPSGNLQAAWKGMDAPAAFNRVIYSTAVDNSQSLADWAAGDVYVATRSNNATQDNVVDVFKPEAGGKEKYVAQLPGPEAGGLFPEAFERYLAVDESNGDVLVAEGSSTPEPVVYVFEPSLVVGQYTLKQKLTGAGAPTGAFQEITGVAVDGGQGDIYVIDRSATGQVVDQFSSEGAYLGHLTGTPSGSFASPGSVAVDSVSHDVYVSDYSQERQAGVIDIFEPSAVVPDVVSDPASNVKARGATLNGTVNPVAAGAAKCHFEWGTSASLGKLAPCEPEGVPDGSGPVPVHAALGGLVPDATYYYRLQASNAAGTNPGEATQGQEFRTAGPGIEQESASIVTSDSATLGVKIDPDNATTSYYFQYGTSTAYDTSLPAPPGLSLGAGKGFLAASVHLQGLAAGTTYHYRVLAVSEPGGEPVVSEGPDETFTTQAAGSASTLPDGRQWEMASPPNKQGSGIIAQGEGGGGDVQASADGDGITYTASSPFVANPAGSRSLEYTQVISRRNAPDSWQTADITTAHNERGPSGPAIGHAAEYKLFSSDLSLGLIEPAGETPLPPLPAGSEKTIYLREADGGYRALVTPANVPAGTEFGHENLRFISASSDLHHVVLASQVPLVKGAPLKGELYEWAEGQLQLVSRLPSGEPTAGHLGESDTLVRHAISNDGTRLVWQAYRTSGNVELGHLYLRDMVKGETVQVDAAQGTPEPQGVDFRYRTASSDGSRVFFTSGRRLTANATFNPKSEDLYVFEVTSDGNEPLAGKLTDLTADSTEGESAGVQGVIGASEDGSYVYFVAGGLLGDAAQHGAEGDHYLYVEHYDEGARAWTAPKFIAALSGGDGSTWGDGDNRDLFETTSRVSPDGRYLAFMSEQSLTGYENRDANSDAPDEEVFLYDAVTNRVVCASCNPSGARPVGLEVGAQFHERLVDYAQIWENRWLAGSIPGWTAKELGSALYQSRYLSDSGRLFFDSADALVPADVNGKEDVYEYEPAGIGGCQSPDRGQSASDVFSESVGGCVALISSGTSSEESAFMDASETGGDVFFLTSSKLASRDYDTSVDLYDAHECTVTAPCAPAVALTPPPCTTGDACKAGPTPQPTLFGAPSSETFSGAGDVVPSASGPVATTRSSGRTQKLAKALKACAKKSRGRRPGCERQARKKYGARRSRAGKSLSARAGR